MASGGERDRRCELGYLRRAEGSCLYSLGATVVLASVSGPGDLRSTKQLAEKSLLEIYYHTKVGGSMATSDSDASSSRNVQRTLQAVCESYVLTKQFPRTTIVVTVQEMHDDGCVLASAINATCLALLDAGLPMRTIFAAVTCVLSTSDDGEEILRVEPNLKEERENGVRTISAGVMSDDGEETLRVKPNLKKERENGARAMMIFVFESEGSAVENGAMDAEGTKLGFSFMEGLITQEQLKMAQELARAASEDVFRLYRTVIEKRFSKRVEFVDRGSCAFVRK